MAKELYDYQQKIVDSQHNPSSSLFMDMGTGKTVTSLALFKKWRRDKLLILCVISKLNDWCEDVKSELGLEAVILNKGSKKNSEIIQTTDKKVLIVNYESAWRSPELLKWCKNDTYIIVDESHKIKNVKSKIGKFCTKLRGTTEWKCILTGTPQSKGYIDYYNQLLFVDIIGYPYKMFCDNYCVYELEQYSGFPFKKLTGYKNTDELDKVINENCVFFKRDMNNDQIPEEIDVKFDKPKKYSYFKSIRVYEDYIADTSSKLFISLRKICSGMLDKYEFDTQKIQWMRDFCDDLNERVVIFYNFNSERDQLIKLFTDLNIPFSQYNGAVKDLTNFKENKNGVVLCQYMSASLGLNDLVISNICIMFSPSTNYTDYIQSKKRIDRIGQTRKPLFYNLYCRNTVEEKILETIKKGQDFDDKMFEEYLSQKEEVRK